MLTKWNKMIAFILSVALVITTFGSDFANARVYAIEDAESELVAVEQAEEAVPEENTEESEPSIFEYFEQTPDEENTESTDTSFNEEDAADQEEAPAEEGADGEIIDATAEGTIVASPEGTDAENAEVTDTSEVKKTAKAMASDDAGATDNKAATPLSYSVYVGEEEKTTGSIDIDTEDVEIGSIADGIIATYLSEYEGITFSKATTDDGAEVYGVRKESADSDAFMYSPNSDLTGDWWNVPGNHISFFFDGNDADDDEDDDESGVNFTVKYFVDDPKTEETETFDIEKYDEFAVDETKFDTEEDKYEVVKVEYWLSFEGSEEQLELEADGDASEYLSDGGLLIKVFYQKKIPEPEPDPEPTYTVTFYWGEPGTEPAVVKKLDDVKEGATISAPDDIDTGAWQISGWYTVPTYGAGNAWNFKKNTVTDDLSLYAKGVKVSASYFMVFHYESNVAGKDETTTEEVAGSKLYPAKTSYELTLDELISNGDVKEEVVKGDVKYSLNKDKSTGSIIVKTNDASNRFDIFYGRDEFTIKIVTHLEKNALGKYEDLDPVYSKKTYGVGEEVTLDAILKEIDVDSIDAGKYTLNRNKCTPAYKIEKPATVDKSKAAEFSFDVYFDRNDTEVGYFVLLPGQTVPSNSDKQSTLRFFPNKTGIDKISDFDYTGTAERYDGTPKYNYNGITISHSGPPAGAIDSDEVFQELFGGALESDIVWYTYKQEVDGKEITYHIDGYVKPFSNSYKIEKYYQDENGNFPDTPGYSSDPIVISFDPQTEEKSPFPYHAVVEQGKEFQEHEVYDGVNYTVGTHANTLYEGDLQRTDKDFTLRIYYYRDSLGKQLIVNALPATKEYDGVALDRKEFTFEIKNAEGEKASGYTVVSAVMNDSITDVGTTANTISSITVRNDKTNVTTTYNVDEEGVIYRREGKSTDPDVLDLITVNFSTLEVTPATLRVTAEDKYKTYGEIDGAEDTSTLTAYVEKAIKNEAGDITSYQKITDPGVLNEKELARVQSELKYTLQREKGENVRWNDREATADEDRYDSYPISFEGKNAGVLYDEDITNYYVEYVFGDFIIKARPLTLESGEGEKSFDGTPLFNTEVKVVAGELQTIDGVPDEIHYTILKDSYALYPTGDAPVKNDYDYERTSTTDNYDIKKEYGYLVITPYSGGKVILEVQAKVDNEGTDYRELIYDGKYHTLDVDVKVNGNACIVEYTEEDPQVFPDIPKAVQDFLDVIKDFFVITASAADDHRELKATFTVDGVTFTVRGIKVYGTAGKNVGEYDVTLDTTDIVLSIDDVQANKDIVEVRIAGTETPIAGESVIGKLVIKPRPVLLRSESATKVYDGSPLTRPNISVAKGADLYDFVPGEVKNLRATGSVTYPGESVINTIAFDKVSGKFLDSNYIITEDPGTLTITPVGGDDTPPGDPDGPPSVPVVLGATRPEVLGATREQAAVLGARRAGTSDDTNMLGRIITIIAAAAIGFIMVFIKRKKEEDQ